MDALEVINNIVENDNLINANLKYCLVTSNKVPMRYDGVNASPNNENDFVSIEYLVNSNLLDYACLGISVQASNISAIDVDDCFKEAFNQQSVTDQGLLIINMFKDSAYIEFSFSGHGMRIFFISDIIPDYTKTYYIKNSKLGIEFYQPVKTSYRYVTITGRYIVNNPIKKCPDSLLNNFLNTYMVRPKRCDTSQILSQKNENKSFELLWEEVKYHYLTNTQFQNIVLSKAPGSGKDESERDFFIISYIHDNITTNKDMIRRLFEKTYYFSTKDWKHKNKWYYNNYRYYDYIYDHLN